MLRAFFQVVEKLLIAFLFRSNVLSCLEASAMMQRQAGAFRFIMKWKSVHKPLIEELRNNRELPCSFPFNDYGAK